MAAVRAVLEEVGAGEVPLHRRLQQGRHAGRRGAPAPGGRQPGCRWSCRRCGARAGRSCSTRRRHARARHEPRRRCGSIRTARPAGAACAGSTATGAWCATRIAPGGRDIEADVPRREFAAFCKTMSGAPRTALGVATGMTRRAARAVVVLAIALGRACAPKVAPPTAAGAARYPDFVYPGSAGARRRRAGPRRGTQARLAAGCRRATCAAPSRRVRGSWCKQHAGVLSGRRRAGLRAGRATASRKTRWPASIRRRARRRATRRRWSAAAKRCWRRVSGMRRCEAFEAALAADAVAGRPPARASTCCSSTGCRTCVAAATRAADAGRLDEARAGLRGGDCRSRRTARSSTATSAWSSARRTSLAEPIEHLRKAVALDPADARRSRAWPTCSRERGDVDGGDRRPRTRLRARAVRRPEAARSTGCASGPNAAVCRRSTATSRGLPQVTRGDLAALIGVRLQAVLSAAKPRRGRGRHRRSRPLGGAVDRRASCARA